MLADEDGIAIAAGAGAHPVRLGLCIALLMATGCTGTNLDAGLSATGLTATGLDATTTVAAAAPDAALLPPEAVPSGVPTGVPSDDGADAGSPAIMAAQTVGASVEAVEAAVAVPSAPVPPAAVPTTVPARATAAGKEARPFRLLALAPTETRRQKRNAFRARAERAALVDRSSTEPRTQAGRKAERRAVRIVRPRQASERTGGRGALPGVRSRSSIFQIGPAKTNDGARSFRVASAAGLARLSGNGLRRQTAHVKTECFKPALVAVLRQAEQHFGRPVMVTSGYRSPKGNSRAGGARGSKHISCEAADFQIEGVSKWKLAKYLRALPGRGGVGTYCHTQSVHYDIGSKRDWNWGCRKR